MDDLKIEYLDVKDLKPYDRNARKHQDEDVAAIVNSIKEFGFSDPIGVWGTNNEIVEGHGRLEAAKKLKMDKVPVIHLDHLTDEQRRAYALAHNKTAELSSWLDDVLSDELDNIFDIDMTEFGFDLDSIDEDLPKEEHNSLTDKFIVPPFSILDTRQGYWQDRKKAWKDLGIKSEVGRDAKSYTTDKIADSYGRKAQNGTSIFDPVLCEIMYKWYCPQGGAIYDCFAGGSVRGIVADKLGYKYTGIDIRQEQVDANYENASDLDCMPVWYCDDSMNVDKYLEDGSVDLVFSCPPYADLEVYSDIEGDISNMEYEDFCKAYKGIIDKACNKLKENRFAVFVVGDVRDKNGAYRNFVDYTKKCFNDNGLVTYNEAILIDMLGTAMIRANQTFKSRKLVKVHQNVLIFYKGDIKEIKNNFDEIEIDDSMFEAE